MGTEVMARSLCTLSCSQGPRTNCSQYFGLEGLDSEYEVPVSDLFRSLPLSLCSCACVCISVTVCAVLHVSLRVCVCVHVCVETLTALAGTAPTLKDAPLQNRCGIAAKPL